MSTVYNNKYGYGAPAAAASALARAPAAVLLLAEAGWRFWRFCSGVSAMPRALEKCGPAKRRWVRGSGAPCLEVYVF